MKKKQVYSILFLTSLFGAQISADPVTNALRVIRATVGQGGNVPGASTLPSQGKNVSGALALPTLGAMNYSALKIALSGVDVTLTETTGAATLTTKDNFSFDFDNVAFAIPVTTWPHTALPNLYTLLSSIPDFNLSTGVTYLMLAFDANSNLIKDLTSVPNLSGLNFYMFIYDVQGTSLFPEGIPTPIATMGTVFSNVTSIASNVMGFHINDTEITESVNYPASLTMTSPTQQAATANPLASATVLTLGALNYSALKAVLSNGLPLSEVAGMGTLTTKDNFSFNFDNVGFACPTTTWPHVAVPNLYALLNAIPGFNLSTGVTYVMLAFDENGNLIKDLTSVPNLSGLNFYMFVYDAQGVSLFLEGIPTPIATMGTVFGNATSIASNVMGLDINGAAITNTVNYPASLIVTSPAQKAAAAANPPSSVPANTPAPTPANKTAIADEVSVPGIVNALEVIALAAGNTGGSTNQTGSATSAVPGKSSLTKPIPSSTQINLNPTVDPKTLPGVTQIFAIPSTVTAIEVVPATNVGDLYTAFSFTAANLALINAALAKGTSLQFALNVQQNNANYNVTGTVYDLQNNVIATEVRNNVVNRAEAGVTNTANIAVGSAITAPAVFTYYDINVTLQGQTVPVSKSGMSLSSTAIFAAPVQSVAINSPIQKLEIICGSSVPWLYVDVLVSPQNMLDMNAVLAAGQALTMSVTMMPNALANYDFLFVAYDATGSIIAQEARASVVNSSIAKNTANIAFNEVIPVAAGTFTGATITCTLMNTQEVLNIENVPFTNAVTLAPTIPASSVVVLPVGITSLTDINVMAQFGTTATPAIVFEAANFNAINAALKAGDTVSVQCLIENDEILLGAYNFTAQELLAIQNYGLPTGVTAAEFSGYELQYLVANQAVGTTVPANQTFQCAVDQTVAFIPAIPQVSVAASMAPGKAGATTFVANAASLQAITAQTEQAYNQATPASVVGGLSALQLINVQLTDANNTAILQFNFTPTSGLQNVTQELLDNGLYICTAIVANTPAQGQFSAVVTLEDAQGNVYATGSAPITVQMVYGWVGFNMQSAATAQAATTTCVQAVPLAAQQAVLYRQQTVTSPVQ